MQAQIMSAEEFKLELSKKDAEIERLHKMLLIHEEKSNIQIISHQIEDAKPKEEIKHLTKEDVGRYSRQLILPEFGVQGQIKLKNSAVLIVGAGGLGCPAAIYLAAAGIGRIGVVDYDEVELSNLHRQILHTTDRVGISKSMSIAQSCYRLNPSVDYVPYHLQLDSSNALDIIRNFDIILDATDNVATRYLLNDACVLADKPLVSGSALRFEGQLTVYNCNGGPCYRCLYPRPPPPEAVTNCSEGGVIGVVPGIIGSLQALEAIKIASGLGTSFQQRLLLFDALDGTFRSVKLRGRSKECSVCGESPSVIQLIDYEQFCGSRATDKDHQIKVLDDSSRINVKEYWTMLQERTPHILLDVRPIVEVDICKLPHPAINIPFTAFINNVTESASQIVQEVKDLAQKHQPEASASTINVPVVCVCRRGNDSQLAVEKLQKELAGKGVKVLDIKGGLHSWSKEVDPEFPVY